VNYDVPSDIDAIAAQPLDAARAAAELTRGVRLEPARSPAGSPTRTRPTRVRCCSHNWTSWVYRLMRPGHSTGHA